MLAGSPPSSLRSKHRSSTRYARLGRLATVVAFIILGALACSEIISWLLSQSTTVWRNDIQVILATWGLSNTRTSYTTYPTSFTRGINPIPIHSHNDYWRPVPLYSALAVGAMSVEADVWEYGQELYVGHDASSLTRNRTFRNLYVDPIARILERQNPATEFVTNETNNGVYDEDPEQTLHLFIDLKTPGHETFPVVIEQLEALRTPHNYLTYFNGTHVVPGRVTVHMTGDTPFELLVANTTYRDYFFDAPLTDLESGRYDPTNSLIASTPFHKAVGRIIWGMEISEGHKAKIRDQIKAAHDRGIMVRYWSAPQWPISLRNKVWKVLVEEGVDLLNVDDLRSAAYFEW